MAGTYYVPFSLRIPDDLLDKIKKLAVKNKRSTNKQVEFMLEKYMEQWETENGPLPPWEP